MTATPNPEWRCFHCDEAFTDTATAREHFGSHEICDPICCMSPADVRSMEHELERYRAEDSDKDREFYGMRADHARALINEEQKGYDRGLADGRAYPTDTSAPVDGLQATEILARLSKWDKDYPVNCWNGYAGLKELDKIVADARGLLNEEPDL